MERSPTWTLTSIGKKVIRAMTMILGTGPKPNQIISSGVRVTMGVALTRDGQCKYPALEPAPVGDDNRDERPPTTNPRTSPTRASTNVTAAAVRYRDALLHRVFAMSDGAGRR